MVFVFFVPALMTQRTQLAASVVFLQLKNFELAMSSENTLARSFPATDVHTAAQIIHGGLCRPPGPAVPHFREMPPWARAQVMSGDHGGEYVTRLWDTGEESDYWRPGVDAEKAS